MKLESRAEIGRKRASPFSTIGFKFQGCSARLFGLHSAALIFTAMAMIHSSGMIRITGRSRGYSWNMDLTRPHVASRVGTSMSCEKAVKHSPPSLFPF